MLLPELKLIGQVLLFLITLDYNLLACCSMQVESNTQILRKSIIIQILLYRIAALSFTMFGCKFARQQLKTCYNRHLYLQNFRRYLCTCSSSSDEPKVAIVGSGPAGFYAAQQILKV